MFCFEFTLRQGESHCLFIGFGTMNISFMSENLNILLDSKNNVLRCSHFANRFTLSLCPWFSDLFSEPHIAIIFQLRYEIKNEMLFSVKPCFSGCVGYDKNKSLLTQLSSHIISFKSSGIKVTA